MVRLTVVESLDNSGHGAGGLLEKNRCSEKSLWYFVFRLILCA
ncbi:hypothetical protein MICA_1878 [Micavibrio aeruginosavorus ARL-13]|uniref:Uncharacterized protein n=1 Tax=Micavibrio aeruginosavorus (strain ARL-13) TaxID=856793 RepID=G2KM93_MICAA|nr:hypothetical protein MICA_1878 [Micavibrio aeruginosavorus ARL-13]